MSVGIHHGRFEADQLMREIERAYRMGDLAPGKSSLTAFHQSFEAEHALVADFMEVSRSIRRMEAPSDCNFLSVFIAPDEKTRAFAEVYCATWHGMKGQRPTHAIVDTVSDAETMLGTRGLADLIEHLAPREGVVYGMARPAR